MAERYLTRAKALSSGMTTKGLENSGERASDWVALMKFLSEKRPPSTRAADAMVRHVVQRVAVSLGVFSPAGTMPTFE